MFAIVIFKKISLQSLNMKRAYLFLGLIYFAFTCAAFSQNRVKEEKAIMLYEEKQLDAAKALFEEILIEEPNNANVQEYLGNIAFDKMEYQKAASHIKTLLEKYPDEARYHFKYGGAIGLYAKNNKLNGAFLIDDIKKHFHKAVDLDNKFVDAYLALVHLYIELPSIFGGSKEKALLYANQVKKLSEEAGKEAMKLIANAN